MSPFDPRELDAVDPKRISSDEFRDLLERAATQAANVDGSGVSVLAAVGPEVFTRLVGRARRDQLEAVMNSEVRRALLDQIFHRFADHYRPGPPRPAKVVHWHVTGPAGVDTFELVLRGDTCEANRAPAHEPHVELTLSGPDFLLVTSGNAKPMTMFLTKKIKVKGDLSLAAVLNKVFDTPAA